MNAPLDKAMVYEIKDCIRKEFTVYFKNDGILPYVFNLIKA